MKMNHGSTDASRMKWALGGAAVGALTMFLLDPEKGNRRRAEARDKMYSAMVKTRKQVNAKARDLANRAKGLRAEAGNLFSEVKDSNPTERPTESSAANSTSGQQ
jgi:gas vesicle protein